MWSSWNLENFKFFHNDKKLFQVSKEKRVRDIKSDPENPPAKFIHRQIIDGYPTVNFTIWKPAKISGLSENLQNFENPSYFQIWILNRNFALFNSLNKNHFILKIV